jgi:hypothetical protein
MRITQTMREYSDGTRPTIPLQVGNGLEDGHKNGIALPVIAG